MSALPEVARRTSEAPTIYFDYLLASVVPYAYFRGRVRGLVQMFAAGYIDRLTFLQRVQDADRELQEKLDARR
jgi:hypothetical protein